jgi:hypothetical protein
MVILANSDGSYSMATNTGGFLRDDNQGYGAIINQQTYIGAYEKWSF